jgi:regulator of replication initiation timing
MKTHNIISILIISIFLSSCGMNSIEGMKNNIDEKSNEITDLKNYFKEIVPENYIVRIQYNSSNNVDLFVYEPTQDSTKREKLFGQWDVNLDDYKETPQTEYEKKYHGKTKSLELVKNKLNWTTETFSELYEKLEKANCIGICNRKPIEIEYGFNGMALLSFLVFDENLTAEQQEEYSDDCMSMFYKENIVLNYGSGATGSLCTPEFKRKK